MKLAQLGAYALVWLGGSLVLAAADGALGTDLKGVKSLNKMAHNLLYMLWGSAITLVVFYRW